MQNWTAVKIDRLGANCWKIYTADAEGDVVCQLFDKDSSPFFDAAKHARLIAKVPELQKAAIAVVASSHKLQDGQHDTPDGKCTVDEAAVMWLADLLRELSHQ